MLEDFLDSGGVIGCESEVMLHYTKNLKSMDGGKEENWRWDDYEQQLIDRLRDIRERNVEKHAVGITIMYGQGAQVFSRQLAELCQHFDIPIIHLMRRNKLRMIVSRVAMRHEGESGNESNGERKSHGDNIGHGKNSSLYFSFDVVLCLVRFVKTQPSIRSISIICGSFDRRWT